MNIETISKKIDQRKKIMGSILMSSILTEEKMLRESLKIISKGEIKNYGLKIDADSYNQILLQLTQTSQKIFPIFYKKTNIKIGEIVAIFKDNSEFSIIIESEIYPIIFKYINYDFIYYPKFSCEILYCDLCDHETSLENLTICDHIKNWGSGPENEKGFLIPRQLFLDRFEVWDYNPSVNIRDILSPRTSEFDSLIIDFEDEKLEGKNNDLVRIFEDLQF